jgi:hypothetical protein
MPEENPRPEDRERIRIKIERKQIAVFFVVLGIVAAAVGLYFVYANYLAPVTSANFDGVQLGFRADLREAQKISAVPDETSLQNFFARPLTNITIAFKPIEGQTNGWYGVESAEIVLKLKVLYALRYGIEPAFNGVEIDDYTEIRGEEGRPVIALVHPEIADETSVRLDAERHIVTISGKDTIKDFDLATVKFLISVLGIEI